MNCFWMTYRCGECWVKCYVTKNTGRWRRYVFTTERCFPNHDLLCVQHIFTHRSLSVAYNGDRIVEANLTSENPVPIEKGRTLKFTYSVHWKTSAKPFENRFDRYLEDEFFEHQIHWFSVFNSFMMVVFLCGLVGLLLLRTLRHDLARYESEDLNDLEAMHGIGDDSGWKQIHGDVFRAPVNLVFFSALLGTGWQLLALALGVILYAMAGTTFP